MTMMYIKLSTPPIDRDLELHGLIRHNVLLSVKECLEACQSLQNRYPSFVWRYLQIRDIGTGFDLETAHNTVKGLQILGRRMQ